MAKRRNFTPDLSKVSFQFGECLLDGIEIRRVRREVQKPAAVVVQGLSRLLVPMGRQIVQDDNGAGGDLRDKHFSDVDGKGGAIHGTLNDPWWNQSIRGQPGDQRLGSPTAKRCIHGQAMTPLGPATQTGQVGLHCRFINKDNAFGKGRDGRQPMLEPLSPLLSYLGATALGGSRVT